MLIDDQADFRRLMAALLDRQADLEGYAVLEVGKRE